jgi:hypothetical protein
MARRKQSRSTHNRRSNRSEAAKKGWRTRLANAANRSEAAKKGWRTRRKNKRKTYSSFLVTKIRGEITVAVGETGTPKEISVEVRRVHHKREGRQNKLRSVDFVVNAPSGTTKTKLNKIIQDELEDSEYWFIYEHDDDDSYWAD